MGNGNRGLDSDLGPHGSLDPNVGGTWQQLKSPCTRVLVYDLLKQKCICDMRLEMWYITQLFFVYCNPRFVILVMGFKKRFY